MKLYHGTNGAWIGNVLRVGLEPRGRRAARDNWKHVAHRSNLRAVYLTDSYAPYFAHNAQRGSRAICAVVEVETERLDSSFLLPDEDCWEQLGRGRDDVPGTMSERTLIWRRRIDAATKLPPGDPKRESILRAFTHTREPLAPWELSLRALGTCCHYGTIPTTAITRAVTWPYAENAHLQLVWDPSITLMNQHICGDRYRALSARLFGDEPNLGPLREWDRPSVTGWELRQGTLHSRDDHGQWVSRPHELTSLFTSSAESVTLPEPSI